MKQIFQWTNWDPKNLGPKNQIRLARKCKMTQILRDSYKIRAYRDKIN